MHPDEPNDEEQQEQLPQDNQTPFQPADDSDQSQLTSINDTHPATDTGVDSQELYDEGVAGATEIQEPNATNNVVDYHEPEHKDS